MNRPLLRNRLARTACLIAFLLLCLSAISVGQNKSNKSSKSSIADFVNSVAELTYNLAWPTATYKKCEISDITPVATGFDVIVKLSGISAFDDDDLWLKLGFKFRDGDLKDVRVVDHNALLMPPFKTMEALASITADLAKQYSESVNKQNATPVGPDEAAAVCLVNSTNATLVFSYRWGDGPWEQGKLEAAAALLFWWPYRKGGPFTSPSFEIRYDDNFEEGYTEQAYVLLRYAARLPLTCDAARKYEFTSSGTKIALHSVN